MLPQKAIQEFKKLYEKRFKEKLPEGEATQRAIKFFNLMKTIYDSYPKNKR